MRDEALFGLWLRRRRKSLGLTQSELADLAGCSTAMVRKIEAEERRPSFDLGAKFADILEIPGDERKFFIAFARGGWADTPPRSTPVEYDRPWLRHRTVEQRADVDGHQPYSALVGRKAEMDLLEARLSNSLGGEVEVALISGEAGQGKTALMRAFAQRAQEHHPEILVTWGSCNAYTGPGDPYLPFREVLLLLVGDLQSGLAGGLGRAHVTRLHRNAKQALQTVMEVGPELFGTVAPGQPLLQHLQAHGLEEFASHFRSPAASTQWTSEHVPQPRAALMSQYLMVLAKLAQDTPLLLFLDDLQWIDRPSADLLLYLGKHLASSRVMIIGSYRGSEVSAGREGVRHPLAAVVNEFRRELGEVVLDLDQPMGREFLDEWLDREPNLLGEEFREALLRQTGGHPLFTVELVRALQEQGAIVRDAGGHWITGRELSWEALPARIEGVIDERTGRLAPQLLQWLQVAAVEGEEFTAEVISHVLNLPIPEVRRGLSSELGFTHRLVAAQEVRRSDGKSLARYRFRHNLIQRHVYERLDQVERSILHEAVAEALIGLYGNRTEVLAIQLAHHFEQAGEFERAAHNLRLAAQSARRAGALEEAVRYYRTALAYWPDPGSKESAVIERELAECQWLSGQLEESYATLGHAFETFSKCNELEGAGAAQRLMGRVCWELGLRAESMGHYKNSLEILSHGPETRELAWTLSSMSQMHMLASEYTDAIDWGERALELALRLDAEEVVAHALNNIGSALAHSHPQRSAEGLGKLEESRRLAFELGLAHDAGRALFNLAEALRAHGRLDEARRTLQEHLSYAERLRLSFYQNAGSFELFDLERRSGNWGLAFRSPAWRLLHEPGKALGGHDWTLGAVHIAAAHIDLGEPEVALDLLDSATTAINRQNELQILVPYLGERLRALARLGREEEVEEQIVRLLGLLGPAPFTIHSGFRGLLSACEWLAGRRHPLSPDLLLACLSELQRLRTQYRSPVLEAAAEESGGYGAISDGRHDEAVRAFQRAAHSWEVLDLPLDRLRALDAARDSLMKIGDEHGAQSAMKSADAILESLSSQLEGQPTAVLERVHRDRSRHS